MDITEIRSPTVHDDEPFEYSPISADDGIRLVKVLPASFHEPIACTLVDTELHYNPSYEALSYTWGDHQNLVFIKVNEKSFGITHNLATALRYLRKEREITLWIDAICINQKDKDERTQQVALMTKIYRHARQVQIWLGPASDDSEMVMDLFGKFIEKPMELVNESLSESDYLSARIIGRTRAFLEYLVSWPADELDLPDQPLPMEGPTPSEIKRLRGYLMDRKRAHLRRALEALLQRDYWYRAWVVQEILMASSISLNCGKSSVPWESVTTVVKAFMEETSRKLDEPGQVIDLSMQTRHMTLATFETIGYLASVRRDEHASRGPEWLLQTLLKLRHFKSKDPRDKIFSLLGLINREKFQSSPSEPPILSVDYNRSFFEVSRRLFKYYVLATSHSSICEDEMLKSRASNPGETARTSYKGSLNILSVSQPTNRSEGFPSWLPDFSRDNGMELWPCFGKTQCSQFEDPGPWFSPYGKILETSGVAVTLLEQSYVAYGSDDPEATDYPCLVTRVWNFMTFAEKRYPEALTTADFWALLQLGKNNGKSIKDTLCKSLDEQERKNPNSNSLFWALERGIGERNRAVASFLDNFRRTSLYRRFAIIPIERTLHPAMVPAEARPEDVLFLLRDSDYPVLLRPIRGQKNGFKFVGPCYIPGWHVQTDPSSYGLVQRIFLS